LTRFPAGLRLALTDRYRVAPGIRPGAPLRLRSLTSAPRPWTSFETTRMGGVIQRLGLPSSLEQPSC